MLWECQEQWVWGLLESWWLVFNLVEIWHLDYVTREYEEISTYVLWSNFEGKSSPENDFGDGNSSLKTLGYQQLSEQCWEKAPRCGYWAQYNFENSWHHLLRYGVTVHVFCNQHGNAQVRCRNSGKLCERQRIASTDTRQAAAGVMRSFHFDDFAWLTTLWTTQELRRTWRHGGRPANVLLYDTCLSKECSGSSYVILIAVCPDVLCHLNDAELQETL